MLSNIFDVEEAMVMAAMGNSQAVALFYDFAAAFPSIEHTLLFSYSASLE